MDFRLRQCACLILVQLNARANLAYQDYRLLTRLDSAKIQAFVNQLPDCFVALGGKSLPIQIVTAGEARLLKPFLRAILGFVRLNFLSFCLTDVTVALGRSLGLADGAFDVHLQSTEDLTTLP